MVSFQSETSFRCWKQWCTILQIITNENKRLQIVRYISNQLSELDVKVPVCGTIKKGFSLVSYSRRLFMNVWSPRFRNNFDLPSCTTARIQHCFAYKHQMIWCSGFQSLQEGEQIDWGRKNLWQNKNVSQPATSILYNLNHVIKRFYCERWC